MSSVLNDAFATLFSDFLYKKTCCRDSFELPRLVEAIQMSPHNICFFYKAVDKSTLTIIKRLIGACAVIRSNTVIKCIIPYLILLIQILHPRFCKHSLLTLCIRTDRPEQTV